MKLLYDISFITLNNLTKGIPVHSFRILQAIPYVDRQNITLLINKELQRYLTDVLKGYNYIVYPHFPNLLQKIFNKILGKFVYKHIVDGNNFDAFIVPNEYRAITIQDFKTPKFIFSHDLKGTKEIYNSSKKKMNKRRQLYHNAIKTSNLVFAISYYTRNDIHKLYPDTDMSKVFVIYNSVKIAEFSRTIEILSSVQSFILSVNHLDPYKNALTTIKAFSLISKDYLGDLVLVSKPTRYWIEECLPYIKKNNLNGRVHLLSNLSDEELRWLYEKADLFVSSSSHEGFGFTPIEAAICCCPVICTDAEALPETTMGLLNYYSPSTDEVLLSKKMLQILDSPPTGLQLREISNLFRQKYSPQGQVGLMKKLISDYFNKKISNSR